MSKAEQYGGVNVTIRLLEQQFLTADDYQRFFSAEDDAARRDLLSEHGYEVSDTDDWETLFAQRLANDYRLLYQAVPDPRYLDLFALRYDYHNLKIAFKAKRTEADLSDLYIPAGHYSVERLKQAVDADAAGDLPTVMVQAIRQVKELLSNARDANGISLLLDLGYLSHVQALCAAIGDEALTALVTEMIDLANLSMALRMQQEERPHGFMTSVLSESGSLSVERLIELTDPAHRSALVQWVQSYTDDAELVDIVGNEPVAVAALRSRTRELVSEDLREARLEAFGPRPLLAYAWFLQQEINNLRLLLIGKENGLDATVIRERMQPIYGS